MIKPLRASDMQMRPTPNSRGEWPGRPGRFRSRYAQAQPGAVPDRAAILRDDVEAEDALQEAYLQAYRTMGSYRGEARLSTWLARVVANEALMRLRKHARRSAIVPLHPDVAVEEINQSAEGEMGNDRRARRGARDQKAAGRAHRRPAGSVPRGVRTARGRGILGGGDGRHPADSEATVRSRFFRARSLLREGLASKSIWRARTRSLRRRALRPHRRGRDVTPGGAAMNMRMETLVDPIAEHARAMIAHLGEDPHRPGLAETPGRFAKAMRFLTGGYAAEPRKSWRRHLRRRGRRRGAGARRRIPFAVRAPLAAVLRRVHVAYLPGDRIIGLSKIPRIVDLYARRLQVQERMTEQVADAIARLLERRACSCSPKRATSAWRCAASRSSTPSRPRGPCAASTRTTRWRARRRSP